MTTPLEAKELAKRMRERADKLAAQPRTPTEDEWLADLREVAAFLEHPVNTGQGVTEPMRAIQRLMSLVEAGGDPLEEPNRPTWKAAVAAFSVLAARTPLASVEGADTLDEKAFENAVKVWAEGSLTTGDAGNWIRRKLRPTILAYISLAQSGRSSAEPVAWQHRFKEREWRQENPGGPWNYGPWPVKWTPWNWGKAPHHEGPGRRKYEERPLYLAPPVRPQEAVAVKALEWIDLSAETPFGTYDVGKYGRYWAVYLNRDLVAEPDSEEAAKAAAQADYEARILSTLSPSGIDLGGEVERLTRERDEARSERDHWQIECQHLSPPSDTEAAAEVNYQKNRAEAAESRLATAAAAVKTVLDEEETALRKYRDEDCQGDDTVKRHSWIVADGRLAEVDVLRRKLLSTLAPSADEAP